MSLRYLMMGVSALCLAACGSEQTPPPQTPTAQASPVPAATETASRTADYNPDRNAYFGDLHIHTRNSFDAFIFNVRVTPDDAYRYARGEALTHPAGFEIKLPGPPLDFVAVTDHAEYLGVLPAMADPDNPLSSREIASGLFSTDQDVILSAFQRVSGAVRSGKSDPEIEDEATSLSVWADTVATADRHYDPGTLTTFAAYEYTSTFEGGNLHRNVFFRGDAPSRPFSTLDSTNPEKLWDWLDAQRADGIEGLAVPHNSNVSNGEMFEAETFDGAPLTAAYAAQRMRNEPLAEITQVKGTSETHPSLSPNDEWAGFEQYEYLIGSDIRTKVSGGFIREAYGTGLEFEAREGFNPYRFGLIASTDTHVAGGSMIEQSHFSKVGIVDGSAEQRGSVPPGGAKSWEGVERDANAEIWFSRWSAAGLAGVWAEENTREAIYDAMRRKETFGTSGPRMRVRLFASTAFDERLLEDPEMVKKAYDQGVPMGGHISGAGEGAPLFLAMAMRDAASAPLQRLQMIKVWLDGPSGEAREQVYDIACSEGAKPDAQTHRCPDNGASVNLDDCSVSADTGAANLRVAWRDPAFAANERAVYYLRVLENPTCRWSTWDALRAGTEPHPDLPLTIQERAWSSPIWYDPAPTAQ